MYAQHTPLYYSRQALKEGGPSGIVTLKYLIEAVSSLFCQPVDARLFEYQPQVGGTFAARSYEDAEQYVEYLHDYCTRLNLWPCISLNTRVLSVTRGAGGGHIVSYQANDSQTRYEWKCDAIAVCSGLHVAPNTPDIRGIQSVPQILHSSELKSRNQFGVDKTVMVVGSEGTGSDTVYLAVTSTTKRVLLCHNDGVHFAPKRNPRPTLFPALGRKLNPEEPGVPIDVSRANLFDTTYVHPLSATRDTTSEISPDRHHPSKIFFNKSMKVCPYISLPHRPKLPGRSLWLYALRSASTGYEQDFPFFRSPQNQTSKQYPIADHTDVRGIWKHDEPTVGFIGFVRPSLGAIPPQAEMQAQLRILNILTPQRILRALRAVDEYHYRLTSSPDSRVRYSVDHESYAYQLALDMDSAPGLRSILTLSYPFLMKTIGHFAVSLLPMMISGLLSLVTFLWATILGYE
ncbi:dimethylaniline monooxygenase [Thelonectria olida]|uniref:Dimethylaniline monooxygenase n=1 Tax=Thelonectria olida TaxID=1576542 RepID=A0A9P8VRH9_9HYPO|nr:dimethylaniline monooxygenase [Thelonectria olida]